MTISQKKFKVAMKSLGSLLPKWGFLKITFPYCISVYSNIGTVRWGAGEDRAQELYQAYVGQGNVW